MRIDRQRGRVNEEEKGKDKMGGRVTINTDYGNM